MKKKRITLFDTVVHIIALILIVMVGYPLILVVSNSFSEPGLVATGQILLWPKGINLEGYKAVFQSSDIMIGYANTIYYTILGTIVGLVVTLPAGYALTKKYVLGRNFFMTYFMVIMYFGGGMIPTFLQIQKMGLYNTRLILILLGAFSTYNCIICRSFFAALPVELEEAAEIDGCGPMRIFAQIVMPLSKALLGVMVLYMAVGHWNSYMSCLIYVNDENKQSLQVKLRKILILAQTAMLDEEGGEYAAAMADREALLRYAVIVVASAPLLIVYPFLQKYFDKGVLIGSVKG